MKNLYWKLLSLALLLGSNFFICETTKAEQWYLYPSSSYSYGGTTTITQDISTTSLVSYWKMDGNSNDSVGSNNGTDTNITYGTDYGYINQGANFNGSSSKIVQGTNVLSTNGTVSFWVYVATTSNKTFITGVSSQNSGINVQLFSSKIYARVGTDSVFINDPNNLPQSQWDHVILTWVGNTERKIYINGELKVTKTTNLNNLTTGTLKFGVTYAEGITDFLNGNLDEINFWSSALSSTTIKALYDAQKDRYLQYPFQTISTTPPLFSVSSTNFIMSSSSTESTSMTDPNTKYLVVIGIFGLLLGIIGILRKIFAR